MEDIAAESDGSVLHASSERKVQASTKWKMSQARTAESLQSELASRCVIGITAFKRPRHLERLVQSIRVRYPQIPIIVGDNGDEPARLPRDVRYVKLPYDCGLSRTRNALVDATDQEYFLLLEEDFCFSEETRIERFADVLDSDPEIGVVGGTLFCHGIKQSYSVDFHRFRETLYLRCTRGDIRVTPDGTAYQICDMCFNFGLFRREMLAEHRWCDELKLGEHFPYFDAVKRSAKWRVANCESVAAEHDIGDRSPDYQTHRRRARAFYLDYLRRSGITKVDTDPRIQYRTEPELRIDRPSVVVLGVGHSGTSVLSKMLMAAGWHCPDADQEFAESVGVRQINETYLSNQAFDIERAAQLLETPTPWTVKDPRFVHCLDRWTPVFARCEHPPLLVWIQRNSDRVIASYVRRGELTEDRAADIVRHRFALARRQFELWPWNKCIVHYEHLSSCAEFIRNAWRSAA